MLKPNNIMQFGKYNWRILDVQDENVLIITEDIIEYRLYDSYFAGQVWEDCTLRQYLNGEFFNMFLPEEQTRILEIINHTPDNPWYGTWGGNDTYDKIFLLSIEEVYQYFGGDGDIPKSKTLSEDDIGLFTDSHNNERQARYKNHLSFWWLRSPGSQCISGAYEFDDTDTGFAAFVSDDGSIGIAGLDLYGFLDVGGIGVRPAMWIKM